MNNTQPNNTLVELVLYFPSQTIIFALPAAEIGKVSKLLYDYMHNRLPDGTVLPAGTTPIVTLTTAFGPCSFKAAYLYGFNFRPFLDHTAEEKARTKALQAMSRSFQQLADESSEADSWKRQDKEDDDDAEKS